MHRPRSYVSAISIFKDNPVAWIFEWPTSHISSHEMYWLLIDVGHMGNPANAPADSQAYTLATAKNKACRWLSLRELLARLSTRL